MDGAHQLHVDDLGSEHLMLTREQILAADDLPRQEVQVKEWGGSVFVRGLNAGEAIRFQVEDEDIQVKLIALATIDEAGNQLFTIEDVAALKKKSPHAVGRLFKAILKLNAMGLDNQKELEKNLGASRADNS